MTQAPPALEPLLAEAWRRFRRSPAVMLPFWVVAAVLFVAWIVTVLLLAGDAARGQLGRDVPVAVAAWVALALVASAAGWAATFAAADRSWTAGRATVRDTVAGLGGRTAGMILTLVALAIALLVALVLAIPTFLLALPACGILTMYAMPVTVLGDRSGFAALAASFALVRATLRRSALVWAVLALLRVLPMMPAYGIVVAVQVLLFPGMRHVPASMSVGAALVSIAASLLLFAVMCAAYGYSAIALTGWYRALLDARASGWPSSASG